ncbi:MAG TPA: 4-hydroxy-tetrahydrodipicolinate reductase [Rhodocyclaceae bacterium]|nr:4-hydroxy-tetrahydrodipicolinate reductase [Rhodocyclaceae bacterium]
MTPSDPRPPSARPLRCAVAGASGRMGRTLVEALLAHDDVALAAAFDVPGAAGLGRDAAEFLGRRTDVLVTEHWQTALANCDCLIDFTRPEGTLAHLTVCRARGINMVVGTTGFDDAGRAAITEAARDIGIVCAPNMAIGMNVLFHLLDSAARALAGFDVEILELHHRHKVDAPSGTALRLGEIVAAAQGGSLAERAEFARHGLTGERRTGSIGFAALRGGDVVGDHTVLFAGTGERIEITHKAGSRMPYALGSLQAARFLAHSGPGLFDMQDVLGLRARP